LSKKKRVEDLEKQSILEKEKSSKLVNEYERKLQDERNTAAYMLNQSQTSAASSTSGTALDNSDARSYLESAISERDEAKVAALERVKAKFKERTKRNHDGKGQKISRYSNPVRANERREKNLSNKINFYERSLNSVRK